MEATKYSEEQLIRWTKPASDSEENRIENTISMVRSAIRKYDWSSNGISYMPTVDLKGSYKSNTNVKRDSDVDLYVLFSAHWYITNSVQQVSERHVGGSLTCKQFRDHLEQALRNVFGSDIDTASPKAFKIRSNAYRVNADVTPFVTANHESNPAENGMCFIDRDENFFINFSEQDYANGVRKNENTGRTYKRIVRILKYIRNDIGLEAPSFLIESLIYNAPDRLFNDTLLTPTTYAQKIRAIAEYLYPIARDSAAALYEVNKIKSLFSEKQKWTTATAMTFLEQVYARLEE